MSTFLHFFSLLLIIALIRDPRLVWCSFLLHRVSWDFFLSYDRHRKKERTELNQYLGKTELSFVLKSIFKKFKQRIRFSIHEKMIVGVGKKSSRARRWDEDVAQFEFEFAARGWSFMMEW
jgi:hypothetical protein